MIKLMKYGTGDEIPEGAVYLCTKTETKTINKVEYGQVVESIKINSLVWHYFLVEGAKEND